MQTCCSNDLFEAPMQLYRMSPHTYLPRQHILMFLPLVHTIANMTLSDTNYNTKYSEHLSLAAYDAKQGVFIPKRSHI